MSDYFGVYILITGFVIIVLACVENIKYIQYLNTKNNYEYEISNFDSETDSEYSSNLDNEFDYDDFAAQNHMMCG